MYQRTFDDYSAMTPAACLRDGRSVQDGCFSLGSECRRTNSRNIRYPRSRDRVRGSRSCSCVEETLVPGTVEHSRRAMAVERPWSRLCPRNPRGTTVELAREVITVADFMRKLAPESAALRLVDVLCASVRGEPFPQSDAEKPSSSNARTR